MFVNYLAVNDGSNDVGRRHLVQAVVQEIAVVHRHICNLAELDGADAVLLMPGHCDVDGYSLQRLLAGDGFGWIQRECFYGRVQISGHIAGFGQSYLSRTGLSHKAVTGKIRMAVGFQEAWIDEILTIVQQFGIGPGNFLRFLQTSYIYKNSVFYYCSLGKWLFLSTVMMLPRIRVCFLVRIDYMVTSLPERLLLRSRPPDRK